MAVIELSRQGGDLKKKTQDSLETDKSPYLKVTHYLTTLFDMRGHHIADVCAVLLWSVSGMSHGGGIRGIL